MPRVLIIDDDVNIRVLLKKILASSNVDVIEATDGAEGLALAAEHRPDLILCDVIMPVMDGLGFLREWALNEEIARIPVMMITSVTEKSRIIDAVKFGACDYIVKPFDPLGVLAKVGKFLKEAEARPRSA